MKILKYLFISLLLMAAASSCQKGIDPIEAVAPGPDTAAPVVVVNYPLEGSLVRDTLVKSTIVIKVNASDDIELKKVSILIDGTEDTSYTSFKDYRRAVIEFSYTGITLGDHVLTVVATDMSDKSTTATVNFKKVAPYAPLNGEVLYMPFDGDYNDLVSFKAATAVGTPGFAAGKVNQAYAGAANAYLTFPTTGLLGKTFSATLWYQLNGDPPRGGILAICRPYVVYNDTTRFKGFRMAREPNSNVALQNLWVNFGIGAAEVWMNPFFAVAPSADWMHVAVSISETHASIYVNGISVKEADITSPIDWTGCTSLSIGSGAPNFTYWEHFSDKSLIDELRIFNKALSSAEVLQIYHMKK